MCFPEKFRTGQRIYLQKRQSGEMGTLMHCWWDCKLAQPLWKAVWRFVKKLKVELLYDPAIPLLGTYSEKPRPLNRNEVSIPVFTAALFWRAKMRATQVLLSRQVDKKVVVHIYNGIVLGHKNNEMLPFATAWMDPEGIMLSEISQIKTNNVISLKRRI